MSTLVNKFAATEEIILAAAVADEGTLEVAYPAGTAQVSFNVGLAAAGHYVMIDDNDKVLAGDPGIAVSFDSSVITITNDTGYTWPAGAKLQFFFDKRDAGTVTHLQIPVTLAGVTAADVVTSLRPGIDGVIEHVSFLVTTAVTTAAKAADLNLEIGTTDLTGGVLALTSAAATPLGKVIEGSAITGNNVLTRDSLLSIEASSVTAFSEGAGVVLIRVRQYLPDAY